MASIIDAFEESMQDEFSIIKYIIFSIPVYYCTNIYFNNSENDIINSWWIFLLTYLLCFGILIKSTANVRNGKNHVLPSFNIFSILWDGIKGTIALGPSIAINCYLASLLIGLISNYITEPNTLNVFKFVIWCLFGSIIFTGYLCYAKNFKIADAYNLKVISDSCCDILVGILFMIPQIILADALLIAPVTYLIWIFFGIPHPVATYYWSMVFVFTLAMTGHYLAQIHYETVATKENQNKIL